MQNSNLDIVERKVSTATEIKGNAAENETWRQEMRTDTRIEVSNNIVIVHYHLSEICEH